MMKPAFDICGGFWAGKKGTTYPISFISSGSCSLTGSCVRHPLPCLALASDIGDVRVHERLPDHGHRPRGPGDPPCAAQRAVGPLLAEIEDAWVRTVSTMAHGTTRCLPGIGMAADWHLVAGSNSPGSSLHRSRGVE